MTWTTRARRAADDLKRRLQGSTRGFDSRKLGAWIRRYQKPLLVALVAGAVLLAVFAFGDNASGPSAVGADDGASVGAVAPVEVSTLCGNKDARPPRRIQEDDWLDYSCQSRKEAARWGACLKRPQYSRDRSMGCPGRQRCCPSP